MNELEHKLNNGEFPALMFLALCFSDYAPRTVVLQKGPEGYGFILRGAKCKYLKTLDVLCGDITTGIIFIPLRGGTIKKLQNT